MIDVFIERGTVHFYKLPEDIEWQLNCRSDDQAQAMAAQLISKPKILNKIFDVQLQNNSTKSTSNRDIRSRYQ